MCLFSSKFVSGSQRHLRKFCVSGHKEESDNAESKQGKTQNFPSPSLSAISTVCIYKNKSERRVRAPKARGIIRGYCGAAHSYGPTQNLHHNNKKQRRLKTFLALPLFCLANTWTASLMERRPKEKAPDLYSAEQRWVLLRVLLEMDAAAAACCPLFIRRAIDLTVGPSHSWVQAQPPQWAKRKCYTNLVL